MIELRKADRRRTLKAAVAAFNDNFVTLDCRVRNISETGCHLRGERVHALPDAFKLMIELDGLAADCRVVWRNPTDLGVKFEGSTRKVIPKRYQSVQPVVPGGTNRTVNFRR